MSFERRLHKALSQAQAKQLYRQRRVLEGPQGTHLTLQGRPYLNFSSNDYLGHAAHPKVREAFQDGLHKYGSGSGAAHLVNGHSRAHHQLEEELAAFTGRGRALLFSTGYMANLGTLSALTGRDDRLFQDRLNHASLIDAGQMTRAKVIRYRHGDTNDLAKRLETTPTRQGGETLIVTDGVFSMDGDVAPLTELARLSLRHQAWLMIDDAHGFGVLGQHGAGSLEPEGLLPDQVPVYMATLGKALGTAGAFVAGDDDLIEYLIQKARPYIYSTALPGALAEASRASLRLLRSEPERRTRLQQNIAYFKTLIAQAGLTSRLLTSPTAIQPVVIGDNASALAIAEYLYNQGIVIPAIRPPTVPEGTARLRITLSADHQQTELNQLVEQLDNAIKTNTP